ncbi:radical SAM protein [Nonomuraea ferruginea]
MRWDNLRLTDVGPDDPAAPLFARGAVARTFETPGFRGMTFYEIQARSIINRVPHGQPGAVRLHDQPLPRLRPPVRLLLRAQDPRVSRPRRGGADFDSKIVVKVNAAELVRKELAAPRWRGQHIAMGTNVDCYQRAEGRYELMRGILAALRDAANPFSVLTKGTLILRDLDLLTEAADRADVGASFSVGFLDPDVWRSVEPGTPDPRRRLEACATLNAHGIGSGVLMAPVLPYLTDSPAQLERTVREIAAAGATHLTPHRAAPAPRRPAMVAGLALPRAPAPRAALSGAVRSRRLRAQGLPGTRHDPDQGPRHPLRHRPRHSGQGPPPPAAATAFSPAAHSAVTPGQRDGWGLSFSRSGLVPN